MTITINKLPLFFLPSNPIDMNFYKPLFLLLFLFAFKQAFTQCAISNEMGISSKIAHAEAAEKRLYRNSCDIYEVDRFLREEMNTLKSTMSENNVYPIFEFKFIEEGYIYSDWGARLNLADIAYYDPKSNIIALGVSKIKDLYEYENWKYLIRFYLYHEVGHYLDDFCEYQLENYEEELFCDFVAGLMLAENWLYDENYSDSEDFYQFHEDVKNNLWKEILDIGDYKDETDRGHHGKPEERLRAFEFGYAFQGKFIMEVHDDMEKYDEDIDNFTLFYCYAQKVFEGEWLYSIDQD